MAEVPTVIHPEVTLPQTADVPEAFLLRQETRTGTSAVAMARAATSGKTATWVSRVKTRMPITTGRKMTGTREVKAREMTGTREARAKGITGIREARVRKTGISKMRTRSSTALTDAMFKDRKARKVTGKARGAVRIAGNLVATSHSKRMVEAANTRMEVTMESDLAREPTRNTRKACTTRTTSKGIWAA